MLNTNDQRWHHSAFEALQQARISILAWNFHQISIHTKTGRFRKHTEKKVMKAKHYFCFFSFAARNLYSQLIDQQMILNFALSSFSREKPSIAFAGV